MSSPLLGWPIFLACVVSSQYNVSACCPGVRSGPVVPVLGRCRLSHPEDRCQSSWCRSVPFVRMFGRCLWSRCLVGAFCPCVKSVYVVPVLGQSQLSVFILVWGRCHPSGVRLARFPRCLCRYEFSACLMGLGQCHFFSVRPGICSVRSSLVTSLY